MNLKSERLKKMENELHDLEQWLKLGLVPKKDLDKHREEMRLLEKKIQEEKERLRFLKESGEMEEYIPPKRPARAAFQEPSMPDMEVADENMSDTGLEMETEAYEVETATGEETEAGGDDDSTKEEEVEDEDPFSDRNRWKRGIMDDPESNSW